jgi:hypothetical protein
MEARIALTRHMGGSGDMRYKVVVRNPKLTDKLDTLKVLFRLFDGCLPALLFRLL